MTVLGWIGNGLPALCLVRTITSCCSPEAAIVAYVRQICRIAEIVRPNRAVGMLLDEADNRVLECAETGRLDLIVSGDRDLLRLKQRGAVPIVRPADFVRTLRPPPFCGVVT